MNANSTPVRRRSTLQVSPLPPVARERRWWAAAPLAQWWMLLCLFSGIVRAEAVGDRVVRKRVGGSELVITTTARVAGAIHSLTWNGKEFLDSFDHGRQLQSASNFDCDGKFVPEVFNPTEAGSLADGVGPTSTSKLLRLRAEDDALETTSEMAFWLAPREKSVGHPACNTTKLSNHRLSKRVKIGHNDLSHAIEYDVTFSLPEDETHTFAQFESLTGYMPTEFERFWKFNRNSGQLEAINAGPGEQEMPLVLATASGSHAMGIYSPDQPSKGYETAGYGRCQFQTERVNKWNCVFRIRDENGVKPGEYRFRHFVIVGTLEIVRDTLRSLVAEFRETQKD